MVNFRKLGEILCSLLVLGLMTTIPIAMLCVGAVYLDFGCPMQSKVPMFLLVSGVFGIVLVCTTMCLYMHKNHKMNYIIMSLCILCVLLCLITFAWTIAGSVWVFKEWSYWNELEEDAPDPCHVGLYLFAFAILIIFWLTFPGQIYVGYLIWRNASGKAAKK